MQDRFKFRVFFKYNQIMYDIDSFCCLKGLNKCVFHFKEGGQKTLKNDEFILMQCTGLRDKNGKLIYENDIVFNNCGQWIIKYCDKCKSFQCFDNTYGCFACEGDYNWFDFLEDLDKTTVIGNTYKNEELLNGTNP